jgi:O-methyltransferase
MESAQRGTPLGAKLRRKMPAALLQTLSGLKASARFWKDSVEFSSSVRKVAPYAMQGRGELVTLGSHVRQVLEANVPGDFVECGVWRGGCSFLMADLLRRARSDRRVRLFDSFEGLPEPDEIDGTAAVEWAENKDPENYFDNCRATLENVQEAAVALGLADRTRMVKGWFDDTLLVNRDAIGPIALLRIDADWHASVECCLESLYDQVSDGGIVILDDYFDWDGCAVAVHEFLGKRRLCHRIRSEGRAAYFQKVKKQ